MKTKHTKTPAAGKKRVIPRFRSEAEEAAWWDSHPEAATQIMSEALRSGKARQRLSKIVTMRLAEADLAIAQQLAERKGLPYQTYIKMLLHQALEKERQAS